MSREIAGAIVLVVLLLLLGLMVLAWRRRARRQGDVPAAAVPDALGDPVHVADLLYVATTTAGAPLDRIASGGLGFRARAGLAVHDAPHPGVLLRVAGAADRWIPAADVRGVDRATWTIDRVVERDGLVLLGWTARIGPDAGDADDRDLDSYFRADDPAALIAAIDRIAPPAPADSPLSSSTPAPKGAA